MNQIIFYELENGKEPVKEWLNSLDSSIRVKIVKRLERIYEDNFGDYKLIAPDLYELRFAIGKGYRIYYTIQNNVIVLLLNAGDKSRQAKDIELAKKYLENSKGEYKNV
jgi:putative addiction module killer protein